jgi:hypothetical protein
MSATKLMQEGYMYVASFNQKDRAQARANFHRDQGYEAKISKQTDSFGISLYSVYIKFKEA